MRNLDELKKILSDGEQTALEILLKNGWKLLTEAKIDTAITAGFRYPTHTIAGRYPVCVALSDLADRDSAPIVETKKRGRPKKNERTNRV
jgi:hypothetical protein